MKTIIILVFFVVIVINVNAQHKKGEQKWYVQPQVSLLNGDKSASGQVQLAGGLEHKAWSFGLGTAIDYYKIRTVPLFIDLRRSFGKNKSFFSYGNIGLNMAWPLESQHRTTWTVRGSSLSNFSNGLYTDIGFGYYLPGNKRSRIMLSIGYSMKTITETYDEDRAWILPVPGPLPVSQQRKLDYSLNRIIMKFGLRL